MHARCTGNACAARARCVRSACTVHVQCMCGEERGACAVRARCCVRAACVLRAQCMRSACAVHAGPMDGGEGQTHQTSDKSSYCTAQSTKARSNTHMLRYAYLGERAHRVGCGGLQVGAARGLSVVSRRSARRANPLALTPRLRVQEARETAPASAVHGQRNACALRARCMRSACAVHGQRMRATYAVHAQCMCSTCAVRVQRARG